MFKYFNTQPNPLLYNDKGQTADGFSWFESTETRLIKDALKRQELIKLDSDGKLIYDDSIAVEPAPEEEIDPGKPLLPENASKNQKSEG